MPARLWWVMIQFWLVSAAPAQAESPAAGPPPDDPAACVVRVDWSRFQKPVALGKDYRDCRRLLENCARYNLAWIPRQFREDSATRACVLTRFDEHGVRPACSVVYGMAALLKCGELDESAIGLSRQSALERTLKLLRGAAAAHKCNRATAGWGDHWQSALWSALLGCGGWLLWDDLDVPSRQLLAKVVVHEADRLRDYQVPYWRGADGEHFPGDTKAEENAWNSMILNVAVAMMPQHPHVRTWKLKSSELMVSSYSTEEDWRGNRTVLDGRAVKDWLRGFNALPGGAVVNHGRLHPDYMSDEKLNLWAYLTQSLAGKPVPQTADFNGRLIYRTFVSYRWPSPPYQAPGGTIYRENQADVYYPRGSDWSTCDVSNYYLNDVWAKVLGWDQGLSHKASRWMELRAARMLAMQNRHPDGRMFARGEYDTYPGTEQMMAWLLGDALLALRLDAYHLLGSPADWLAR
jgi:hypothetical protein